MFRICKKAQIRAVMSINENAIFISYCSFKKKKKVISLNLKRKSWSANWQL